MEMIVHDDERYVEIWLTNAESQNVALRESLTPCIRNTSQKVPRCGLFFGKGDFSRITLTPFDRFCVAIHSVERRIGKSIDID